MKLRALAAAVFVLAFGAAVANAGAASEFGVNAGAALPFGDFGDVAGTGFFGGGTYTYHMNEQYGFGGDINYQKYGKKDVALIGNYEYSLLNYGVHGKYFIKLKDGKEMPYVKVGVGMYNLSVKSTVTLPLIGTVSGTASDTKVGFSAGVGSDFKMGEKNTIGAEILYHNVSADPSSLTMLTVAVRYNWMMGGK